MGDLCSPLKPEEKTYEELVEIVQEHLQPAPSVISERHKFRLRRQEKGESVTQYVVVSRNLAKSCEFKETLDDNLRDQFVSGLHNEVIKQRLFSEKKLNCVSAYNLARDMEGQNGEGNQRLLPSLWKKKSSEQSVFLPKFCMRLLCCSKLGPRRRITASKTKKFLEVSRDVDEGIVTIDDDILKSVTSNSEIAADDDDEEDDSDEPVRKPTNEDMIKAFQTIRHEVQYLEDVPEIITSSTVFLFNYRIASHCTTNSSPAFLMFGRNLKTRLDLIRPHHHNIIQNKQQTQMEQCKGGP
ncbi:hypothetical protein QE152_g35982 [Popillia japonica]|uniref:Retrotransposon gag domain-containing protein n=1 Tax=Popillia japonica TaxID=7064 RepID=A0AAW1IDR7_POPJA